MKKLFNNYWVIDYPINGGENKSFGKVTADELLAAMQHNYRKAPVTPLELWLKETGFLSGMPPELFVNHDVSAFKRILGNYNGDIQSVVDFLSNPDGFYLWLHK